MSSYKNPSLHLWKLITYQTEFGPDALQPFFRVEVIKLLCGILKSQTVVFFYDLNFKMFTF